MKMRLTLSILILLSVIINNAGAEDVPVWYPEFSWEKVPEYKMFGHDKRLLAEKETDFISTTSGFICIEKQHGWKKLGGAELGAQHEIDKFHKRNKRLKGLFYFNSAYAYTRTSYTKNLKYGTIKGAMKDWFVKDPKTGELAHRNKTLCFDVMNADFRNWWSDTVAKAVRQTGADGLFVDQMHGFSWLRPSKRKEVGKAQVSMMKMAKEKLGGDKILLLNNAAHIPDLFKIGDAFMFEHYNEKTVLDPKSLIEDWNLLKKISNAGKIAVWRIGVSTMGTHLEGSSRMDQHFNKVKEFEALAREKCETYLVAFLMGAQKYSYFQYGWGWGLTTGPLVDFPEFRKPLGKPKGDYVKMGEICTREFNHASIRYDLQNQKGIIAWK